LSKNAKGRNRGLHVNHSLRNIIYKMQAAVHQNPCSNGPIVLLRAVLLLLRIFPWSVFPLFLYFHYFRQQGSYVLLGLTRPNFPIYITMT
jgi:hypothetical protein